MKMGKKNDTGKERWDLLPWEEVCEVVKVLTHGAEKYAPNNWQFVEPWKERYFAALMRHLTAWWLGEQHDSETSYAHLAHAVCCLLFLMGRERKSR